MECGFQINVSIKFQYGRILCLNLCVKCHVVTFQGQEHLDGLL
jgi:hypothetical protein